MQKKDRGDLTLFKCYDNSTGSVSILSRLDAIDLDTPYFHPVRIMGAKYVDAHPGIYIEDRWNHNQTGIVYVVLYKFADGKFTVLTHEELHAVTSMFPDWIDVNKVPSHLVGADHPI